VINIGIVIPASDLDEIKSALAAQAIEAKALDSAGFDGTAAVSLIVTLTPMICTFLAKLYHDRMAAQKAMKFKYKGIELTGVSEATLRRLAERAMVQVEKP
jgi:hypothetical protein